MAPELSFFSEVTYFEVFVFFGQVCLGEPGKIILRTPKNLPAPTSLITKVRKASNYGPYDVSRRSFCLQQ